ncbi:MAG: hypothetical protein LE178_00510 [Endomicrobium sp.]|nr:hypothetical protein [Endomicrobium sp.]
MIDRKSHDKIKVRIELIANDTSRKVDVEIAKGRTIQDAVIENVEKYARLEQTAVWFA